MRRFVLVASILLLTACKNCTSVNNPVSPDYPCGTRGHVCSTNPLSCCWVGDDCGGTLGCPRDMCCFAGTAAAYSSAQPISSSESTKPSPQWKP
jgi:hypothetical protein